MLPQAAQALLRPGDTGTGVETLQSALRTTGYYNGENTGFYGALTQTAVTAFQRDRGLVADGVAGADTLSALGLNSAISATSATAIGHNAGAGTAGLVSTSSVGVTRNAVFVSDRGVATGVVETPSKIGINVRNAPYGAIVGGEPDGVTVAYSPASSTFNGGYTWVRRPDGNWVAGDYLRGFVGDGSSPGVTLPGIVPGVYRVESSELNIRATPAGEVIGNLPGGSLVRLTSEEAYTGGYRWGKLSAQTGWVAKEFLTPVGQGGGAVPPLIPVSDTSFAPGTARVEQTVVVVRDRPNGLDTGGALYQGEIVRTTGSIASAGGGQWVELATGGWIPRESVTLISR
jgi:peptidoglycan hydrolase-like protein with peptidoglycan-binding domain